jgi:hypothetical protein
VRREFSSAEMTAASGPVGGFDRDLDDRKYASAATIPSRATTPIIRAGSGPVLSGTLSTWAMRVAANLVKTSAAVTCRLDLWGSL